MAAINVLVQSGILLQITVLICTKLPSYDFDWKTVWRIQGKPKDKEIKDKSIIKITKICPIKYNLFTTITSFTLSLTTTRLSQIVQFQRECTPSITLWRSLYLPRLHNPHESFTTGRFCSNMSKTKLAGLHDTQAGRQL